MKINLFEALQQVLLNESQENDIVNAINNGYRLEITYDDNKYKVVGNKIRSPKGKNPTGRRTILPYCYGEDSMSGAAVLRAFQTSVRSSRHGAPGWKYFKLDNITSLKILKTKPFKFTPREMGYSNAPEFNANGDELMSAVYAIKPIPRMSDLDVEKAKTEYIKTAPKMVSKDGPIPFASQQRKKNVYTSQPRSKKYADIAKNIDQNTDHTIDRFSDELWKTHEQNISHLNGNKAEVERQMQATAPKPIQNNNQPILNNKRTSNDEDDWNEWLNTKHNDF